MSQIKSTGITKLLHFAHNAVMKSADRQEVLSLLDVRGFSRASFERGKALYKAAAESVGAELVIEDELMALDDSIRQCSAIIAEHYGTFTKAAKQSFGKSALTMLELPSRLPRSTAAYCEHAKTTFKILLEHPDLLKHIAGAGWSATQTKTTGEVIESYEKSLTRQAQLKSSQAQALTDRNRMLAELREWLCAFSTAAVAALDSNSHMLEVLEVDIQDLYSYASVKQAPLPTAPAGTCSNLQLA